MLLRRRKLPKGATLHSLRHSHCSHLLASWVPLPAVSARLGHVSIRTTQLIYSHMIQDDEAAEVGGVPKPTDERRAAAEGARAVKGSGRLARSLNIAHRSTGFDNADGARCGRLAGHNGAEVVKEIDRLIDTYTGLRLDRTTGGLARLTTYQVTKRLYTPDVISVELFSVTLPFRTASARLRS
jgi:hypothetical protein